MFKRMKQLQANSGDSWRRNLSKPDFRSSTKNSSVTNRLSMIQKINENKKFTDENKVKLKEKFKLIVILTFTLIKSPIQLRCKLVFFIYLWSKKLLCYINFEIFILKIKYFNFRIFYLNKFKTKHSCVKI